MPPRPSIPSDDLYARLGVPRDASPEAIDLAWRGLLRKHHPDIAGPDALELAKRINVAHDWLSDPDLRGRYDREHVDGIRTGRSPRAPGRADRPASVWRPVRRPPTTAERVDAVVERVGRLTRDELDRLALAEPAPIAFLATLRRFVPPELDAVIDRAEREAMANLPADARRDLATRDAVVGQLADIVLGDILEAILGDPGRAACPRASDARLGGGRRAAALRAGHGRDRRPAGAPPRPHRGRGPCPGRDRHAGAPRHAAVAASHVARRGRRPAGLERARIGSTRPPPSMRSRASASATRQRPGEPPRGSPTCSSCATHSRRASSSGMPRRGWGR